MVRSRLRAPHIRSFKASRNGEVVGSAFISRWGSLAVFGPLTVDPDAWGLGIGSRLLDACLGVGAEWSVTSIGLFTLPESTKHLYLYRKHGFWPGSLTALTEKRVAPNASQLETLRGLDGHARVTAIEGCRVVTSSVREGLDLTGEIECLAEPGMGDVVIVREGDRIAAFALCHVGAASEAVTGSCYVKFAAERRGAGGAGVRRPSCSQNVDTGRSATVSPCTDPPTSPACRRRSCWTTGAELSPAGAASRGRAGGRGGRRA